MMAAGAFSNSAARRGLGSVAVVGNDLWEPHGQSTTRLVRNTAERTPIPDVGWSLPR
jgi:hypothetical protein